MSAPVRSMTGTGSDVVESEAGRFTVEARSVNHRFLKTSVRHHGGLPSPEALVEQGVRARVRCGHVTVVVRYRPPAGEALARQVDPEAFRVAAAHLSRLATESGVAAPTTTDVLAALGGLGGGGPVPETDRLRAPLAAAVAGALDQLVVSREREGARLAAELERLVASAERHVASIAEQAAGAPERIQARVTERLAALLEGTDTAPDPQWLAREVALLADRGDVTEELARLEAHAEQLRGLLAKGGPVGRRLDFLVQELHRETNTIGSKASDLALTRAVMDLKSDVERLREQVQNLE